MNAFTFLSATLYAPRSVAALMAAAELRMRAATVQSVKHEARLVEA
jgi:hypothetical protein